MITTYIFIILKSLNQEGMSLSKSVYRSITYGTFLQDWLLKDA